MVFISLRDKNSILVCSSILSVTIIIISVDKPKSFLMFAKGVQTDALKFQMEFLSKQNITFLSK